ncbi:MAG: hypothetical protein JW955_16485 [Sedimentisphaerales bacterium]|nr:hypothetical protein [Sedimentisphaerales bacterium]
MDKPTLVESDYKAGEALLRALDQAGVKVKAAFWLYLPESDEWRLYLALPEVAQKGPRQAYESIQTTLEQVRPEGLSLRNISAVAPDDKLVKLLRSAIKTGPGIVGIRFTGNVISNVLIEDAYIYRVA